MSGSFDPILRAPPGTSSTDVTLYPAQPADPDPQNLVVLSAPAGSPSDVILWAPNTGEQLGSYRLTGLRAVATQGTLGLGNVYPLLVGQPALTAQGVITPVIDTGTNVALTGLASTSAGATLLPAIDTAFTGAVATTAGGVLGPLLAIPLAGLPATSAGGVLTPSVGGNISVALTGLPVLTAIGFLSGGTGVLVALRSQDLFYIAVPQLMWAYEAPQLMTYTAMLTDMFVTRTPEQAWVTKQTLDLVA